MGMIKATGFPTRAFPIPRLSLAAKSPALRQVAMHRFSVCLSLALLLQLSMAAGAAEVDGALRDPFAFPGEACILEEQHLGIVNGMLSVGIPYRSVAAIDGLWAPPYVSSDFQIVASVLGRNVATSRYLWRPFQVERAGAIDGISVTTTTTLARGLRAGLLAIRLENTTSQARDVPLVFAVKGTLDRAPRWEFSTPKSSTAAKRVADRERLVLEVPGAALVLGIAGNGIRWDPTQAMARGSIRLLPGGLARVYAGLAIAPRCEAIAACDAILSDPQATIAAAEHSYRQNVQTIFEKLPRLRSNNEALVRFYERSLVHLLTNRWQVPEFVLCPYYSTGSVKGGCVGNYLWNFGENWQIMPLLDADATRRHIVHFLRTDMMHHNAFDPVTGVAVGPWYPVNQEKIIGLIYYYVRNTGDMAFLGQRVDGRTVLEHVIAQATYGDDPSGAIGLMDYGPANNHLELRRGYPYNHKMPDLNGRRYASYLMTCRLAEVAGKPAPDLRRRALAIKTVLKQQLWNPQTRWFDFQDDRGRKDTRYTVQIFKLFGSGVLDREEEAGLLGHLNEKEFTSQFGLHSMSKLDVAYDQVDIDNGGGGICTGFPALIAEKLYQAGHPNAAEDILRRILWWADRMPYWGDSLVADKIDYRKDTPLQCTIDGAAIAQCIIFGMCGVRPEFDGSIHIDPHPPAMASRLELQGLRLLGRSLDIAIEGRQFQVRTGKESIRSQIGKEVVLQNQTLNHSELQKSR